MKKWIDASEIKMIHELEDSQLRELDIEMRKIPKFDKNKENKNKRNKYWLGGVDLNFVEPIRDLNVLENMCSYLKKTNKRNYILFMMGIYTGLRISDILKLRIYEVKDKRQITLREKKPVIRHTDSSSEEYLVRTGAFAWRNAKKGKVKGK